MSRTQNIKMHIYVCIRKYKKCKSLKEKKKVLKCTLRGITRALKIRYNSEHA